MAKKHEEHENHERWLVSYADFITLLFAVFTVLYATSQTDEQKLDAIADGLTSAFEGGIFGTVGESTPLQHGDSQGRGTPSTSLPDEPMSLTSATNPTLEAVRRKLEGSLSDNVIEIGLIDNTLNVVLPESVLFDAGSAEIHPVAYDMLSRLASGVKGEPVTLEVSGHADGTPISGPPFEDNWGLAGARALSTVRFLGRHGLDVDHLKATAEITSLTNPERRSVTFRIRADDHAPTASALDKVLAPEPE